jgi:ectoine hydroxylase-related dioxygenase (phytanoyl-CoA dioxygenase family)
MEYLCFGRLWCNVDSTNGSICVAVGSHSEKTGPIIQLHSGRPQDGDESPVIFDHRNYRVVSLNMSAGDAVLFHPNLFHYSDGNQTSNPRTAWSSTWIVPWTKFAPNRVSTHCKADPRRSGDVVGVFDWNRKV